MAGDFWQVRPQACPVSAAVLGGPCAASGQERGYSPGWLVGSSELWIPAPSGGESQEQLLPPAGPRSVGRVPLFLAA